MGNVQLREVIEEFLNSRKRNTPDPGVPITLFVRDGIPHDPAGKILKKVFRQKAQAV